METTKPLRQVGDKVLLDGYASMAQQNAEIVTIKKVDWRFDEKTGEIKQEEQYMIYTAGTNLIDIRYIVGIEPINFLCRSI